ncbi:MULTISPECIES: phosphoribosyltransferase-like protein [Dyella]|uniref:PRTase-CE domain-containing protein n=2 Tax=Dyella TaxID=231454 RepID=A0A4R0YDP3_9GAMM|nr:MULTISPECIES: hypothetical protein [Dyella]TBR36064.1 hypothetical protein EYV96_15770 [Dyella terrae]TCI06114.1 hypothetical protein EZM97_34865 [Dyella soli]
MSERDNLLEGIAKTIQAYRQGELEEPSPLHVDRWARQFTPKNQIPFLREFQHVIAQTFLTKDVVIKFLSDLVTNEALAGKDPRSFWSQANVLRIQKDGQSQKEMVKLFATSLEAAYGLKLASCGTRGGAYIYLDDVLFGGGRVGTDLEDWIKNTAPPSSTVHVILIAYHRLGQYFVEKKLNRAAKDVGKRLNLKFWRLGELENRLNRRNESDVLWPSAAPDHPATQAYLHAQSQGKFPLQLRQPGGKFDLFSSEEGRQVLESEFLIAGVKIRSLSNLSDWFRPLGCGPFGAGFGALIATYRNCPNNCPLALWWGDPQQASGALDWYPLLQRKTYAAPENAFDVLYNSTN